MIHLSLSLFSLPTYAAPVHNANHPPRPDAAQTPPSRFQKRKGSIYAVPHSRDGHIDSNYPQKFHELYAEKGYNKIK